MLTHDIDLQPKEVQDLANRDAVALFFSTLGYNTNERVTLTKTALGVSEGLAANITYVERLAQQDGGLLEVYLFELKSLTTATIEALARFFRNRNADYLLVLTDDYQRIDFVLLQRYVETPGAAGTPGTGLGGRAPGLRVRPRVLTMTRRDPGRRVLRVLRRFSFTEGDTFAQWDKLLSAYEVADWTEPYFNNRALFSDYYLNNRLPDSPEWNDKATGGALVSAFKALRGRYADAREELANAPEETTRKELLEPALQALGFDLRPGKNSTSVAVEPDYRLYASGGAAARPLAVCLAYCWGRNLDGRDDMRDKDTPDEDPGQAAVALLARDEADWAIVTNGKLWRLYAAKAHSRATNYYEIDLEETLAWPDPDREIAFRYFWLLFRAGAFQPVARTVGTETPTISFLDYLLGESERYARELEEELKERIFGEIFPHFARGFIEAARRRGGLPTDLEDRPAEERNALLTPFFGGTLTFLYRLLFLLYAESRNLLPVQEQRGYHPQSLERLKEEVAAQAGPIEDQAPGKLEVVYSVGSTTLYDRLATLFAVVDKGNAALNVPVYNGGLFMTAPGADDHSNEAEAARFLASHKIPDRYLALGLDRMARDVDPKRHDLVFIDYKSLGVRQLGSIYEGLLEFALRVAPEPMAVIKGKRTEEVVPLAEAQQQKLPILKDGRGKTAPDRVLPRGAVYLENNRRERKATGSYYTPDYIVKYIVRHTVGPVLDAKLEALRPAFRAAQQTLAAERAKAQALRGQGGDSAENQAYLKHRDAVGDAFFDLRVLDPAMGSGHFLVEAVDYITDRMAAFLSAFPWNPVRHGLGEIRREITAAMEEQAVSIDAGRLTDLNLLKRQVLKRCIYGVDLNPMAVELAKVSLWLDCFTLGAPLSFLDHHLKAGNSLIGARVEGVRKAIEQGQLSLFGSNLWAGALLATESMIRVGMLSDVTAEEVRLSRQEYQRASDALAPFKRILDLYTSRWFGNKPVKGKRGRADVDVALDFIRSSEVQQWINHPDDYRELNEEQRDVAQAAQIASKQDAFFHWELEFPEVFFGPSMEAAQAVELRENSGFDVVVSNPPYLGGREWEDEQSRSYAYFVEKFSVALYQFDVYVLFTEQSVKLAKAGGFIGLITPNTWLNNQSSVGLRVFILSNTSVLSIVDYSGVSVFESAVVLPIITILKRTASSENVIEIYLPDVANPRLVNTVHQSVWEEDEAKVFNINLHEQDVMLRRKIESISITLASLADVKFGIKIYETRKGKPPQTAADARNRVFEASSKRNQRYRPYLEGEDVHRYIIDWQGRWLQYGENLAAPRDPSLFEGSRLLLRRIVGQRLISAFTDADFVTSQLLQIVKPYDENMTKYVLSILNSILMAYYFRRKYNRQEKTFPEIRIYELGSLPIRRIAFTTPEAPRFSLVEQGRGLYADFRAASSSVSLLRFVDDRLTAQPEEADVVHDLLAFLAEEMIRLNKEKREAQRAFLDWLVAAVPVQPDKDGKTGLDALTGKSRLADFPGDYQKDEPPLKPEELLDTLQKNKARLGVRLSAAGLQERVAAQYNDALVAVLPLKEQLARTDGLIDQIVYRLYGLTAEEIAVVEGG